MPTVRIGTRRNDVGLVAVLEIATADPIEQRRDGGEDRCGGVLLDRLELGLAPASRRARASASGSMWR